MRGITLITITKCILTEYEKEDGQNGEAHKLNWLASPDVNEREGGPVSRDENCRQNQVYFANLMQALINV